MSALTAIDFMKLSISWLFPKLIGVNVQSNYRLNVSGLCEEPCLIQGNVGIENLFHILFAKGILLHILSNPQ